MNDRITFDELEQHLCVFAAVDGNVLSERDVHCFLMAVQWFRRIEVLESLGMAGADATRPSPLTPQYLKEFCLGCRQYHEAMAPDDDADAEGVA